METIPQSKYKTPVTHNITMKLLHIVLPLFLIGQFALLHAEDKAKIEANQKKLETIVLPDVDLQNEPIRTALGKIRDLAGSDKGTFNLVLKASEKLRETATITIVMESPTLEKVLSEVGRQSNLEVVPMEFGIALVEKNQP